MVVLCWDQSPYQRFPAIPFGHSNKMPRSLRRCNAKPMPAPALHAPLLLSTSPNYTTKANDPTLYIYTMCAPAATQCIHTISPLSPNQFSSHGLSDHNSYLGAMATSPMSRGTAPSCKHTAALSASAQCVSPAMCWQSICKSHHPWDSAKFPRQVPLGKFK